MRKSKADRIVYDVGRWTVLTRNGYLRRDEKRVWVSREVYGSRLTARALKHPGETVRRMEAFHIKARE